MFGIELFRKHKAIDAYYSEHDLVVLALAAAVLEAKALGADRVRLFDEENATIDDFPV